MRTRLSVPFWRTWAGLIYLAAMTAIAINTFSDFHLSSFIGGVALAIAYRDADQFFRPIKGHTS